MQIASGAGRKAGANGGFWRGSGHGATVYNLLAYLAG
jgi:hypothetical protein